MDPFFGGALAKQRQLDTQNALQSRSLDIQQGALDLRNNEAKRAAAQQHIEQFTSLADQLTKLAVQAKSSTDKDTTQLVNHYRELLSNAAQAMIKSGVPFDPTTYVSSFDNQVAGAQKPSEMATQAGTASAAKVGGYVGGAEKIPGADRNAILQDQGLMAKPQQPTVSITNTNEKAYSQQIGKNAANRLDKSYETAAGLAKIYPNIKRAEQLMATGKITTGSVADVRLNLRKLLSLATGISDQNVTNTEEFIAMAARQVASVIKEFGSGSGLSDADREYAAKMIGGAVTLNAQSIRRILEISDKMVRMGVENYNSLRSFQGTNHPTVLDNYPEIGLQTFDQSSSGPSDVNSLLQKYGVQ